MVGCFGSPRTVRSEGSSSLQRTTSEDSSSRTTVYAEGVPRQCKQGGGVQKLSPIDHSAILACVNPKALFYTYDLDPELLQVSLAKTLTSFLPLCGRIVPVDDNQQATEPWTPPNLRLGQGQGLRQNLEISRYRAQKAFRVVLCNSGVPFNVVSAPHLSLREDFPVSAMGRSGFRHLNPRKAADSPALPPYFEPINTAKLLAGLEAPLKVRLTQLGCGGSILALTLSHAMLDGHAACLFLNHWAAQHAHLQSAHDSSSRLARLPVPCHDRSLLDPAVQCRTAQAAGVPHMSSLSPSPTVHRTPTFSIQATGNSTQTTKLSVQQAESGNKESNSKSKSSSHSGSSNMVTPSLQCLSLQALPAPSIPRAFQKLRKMRKELQREARMWEGLSSSLTCQVLHIPEQSMAHLKELCSAGRPQISSNDAIASLVWTTMCTLRGRPLPGTAPPGSTNAMALACDLRRNGLAGRIPLTLFANATWCLHIPSSSAVTAHSMRAPVPSSTTTHLPEVATAGPVVEGCEQLESIQEQQASVPAETAPAPAAPAAQADTPASEEEDPLWALGPKVCDLASAAAESGSTAHDATATLRALREGAGKVRGALLEFRAGDVRKEGSSDTSGGQGTKPETHQPEQSGVEVLRLADSMVQAPISSQVMLAAAVCGGQDALLSSWQFPYWQCDFAQGAPVRYQGIVHPNPPWSAAVMSAHPQHGGLYCFMVTPTSASAALRASPVLGMAVPNARWA